MTLLQAAVANRPRDERSLQRLPAWRAGIHAAQEGRLFLWTPVALTLGVWSYFSLHDEPSMTVSVLTGVSAVMLILLGRARPLLLILSVMLIGFTLAKAKTEWMRAPILTATTPLVELAGTVEDSAHTSRGQQVIILRIASIHGLDPVETPARLRLTAAAGKALLPIGASITAKAWLAPLPRAVMPGGFDYGRELWFRGIGGTGRVQGAVSIQSTEPPDDLLPASILESIRSSIGERIGAVLKGTEGAIAEALITGERGGIPREVNQSFQISGLAHVLSISGLHMALVAGGVFWIFRAVLAAFPMIALGLPVKKIAAAAALCAGFFYMLLAGSNVATQRSYIMIAVVFLAVIADRPAFSTRNLALAAVLILLFEPEAALQASFQMSFMAVMGLTAFYEWKGERDIGKDGERRDAKGPVVRFFGRIGEVFLMGLLTTLIAGTLSSIPAAYHFGRIAPLSILANTLALPVISLVIMPMALVSVLLMSVGLEFLPLSLVGWGIDLMIRISDMIAAWPVARHVVPQPPVYAAVLMCLGTVLLCLVRGPARISGLAIVLAGGLLGLTRATPDILIEERGRTSAFLNNAGELVPLPIGVKGFSVEKWLIFNGEEVTPRDAAARGGWTCKEKTCRANVSGKKLLHALDENAPLDCSGVDILIAAFPLREKCRDVPLRIDRFDLWRNGSYSVSIGPSEVFAQNARGMSGNRPWVTVPTPRKLILETSGQGSQELTPE